jgi:hypothetical protein
MARDVKEHAKDLDGLAKNLDKLKTEGEKMQDAARKESHERRQPRSGDGCGHGGHPMHRRMAWRTCTVGLAVVAVAGRSRSLWRW